jgi:hypothetical protein
MDSKQFSDFTNIAATNYGTFRIISNCLTHLLRPASPDPSHVHLSIHLFFFYTCPSQFTHLTTYPSRPLISPTFPSPSYAHLVHVVAHHVLRSKRERFLKKVSTLIPLRILKSHRQTPPRICHEKFLFLQIAGSVQPQAPPRPCQRDFPDPQTADFLL